MKLDLASLGYSGRVSWSLLNLCNDIIACFIFVIVFNIRREMAILSQNVKAKHLDKKHLKQKGLL